MVYIEVVRLYTPKKLKWNSLSELRDHLVKETKEKIVSFDGWQLITESTCYMILDSKLLITKPTKKNGKQNKSK